MTEPWERLEPLDGRVVIRPTRTRYAGSLIIPESAQPKPQEGVVLAIGEGKRLDTGEYVRSKLTLGARVIYSPYSGVPFEWCGEDLISIREADVLCVVREDG